MNVMFSYCISTELDQLQLTAKLIITHFAFFRIQSSFSGWSFIKFLLANFLSGFLY
jgi:hypothetical protein